MLFQDYSRHHVATIVNVNRVVINKTELGFLLMKLSEGGPERHRANRLFSLWAVRDRKTIARGLQNN